MVSSAPAHTIQLSGLSQSSPRMSSAIPCEPSTVSESVSAADPNIGATLDETPASKKKKKKRSKKASASKINSPTSPDSATEPKPPVLCISRNKHWRYISSYHGPWLQLPIELLESLSILNVDPTTITAPEPRTNIVTASSFINPGPRHRENNPFSADNLPLPESRLLASLTTPSFPTLKPNKPIPPPIDPGVFRSVTSIRKLIDEAAELSVRASSGLSATELNSLRHSSGPYNSSWGASQGSSFGSLNSSNSNGRHVAMSAMRIHRLRALAVQKLAQAYRADEVASSVMVMQGGSVFDDLAQRVLKSEPDNLDAKYVHFFHEKIPSRQLAESTTTSALDGLIAAQPQHLEYYRTRGIVHCFREEFSHATKDFTYALKEARAVRKSKLYHRTNGLSSESRGKGGKKKNKGGPKSNMFTDAEDVAASDSADSPDVESIPLHPSASPDAPQPLESQLLFLRGAAYLQQAVFLIEEAIISLEGITKAPSLDGAELRLCNIVGGRYGGVEIRNPDGPLGKADGPKAQAYREVLASSSFRDVIDNLVKKSIRDHEKFLAHFDSLESPSHLSEINIAQRTEHAFYLSESIRPGNQSPYLPNLPEAPTIITTYHPLLVEAHFSILLCLLMLGDFPGILPRLEHSATLLDGLEGYPIFLPPRSMTQAEFVESLERLANGWWHGIQPHSHSDQTNGKAKLKIEGPQLTSTDHQPENETSPLLPATPYRVPVRPVSTPPISGSNTPASSSSLRADDLRQDNAGDQESETIQAQRAYSLDCARILLAPVLKRQRQREEKVALEKTSDGKKPLQINIPLHGPRVEIVLAWLAAVHLVELEKAA